MGVSARIKAAMEGSSWIRRMFEEGAELKARLGPEKVFDFTLGNPDLEPPARFKEELAAAAQDPRPRLHSYMPNAGLSETRKALAGHLAGIHGLPFMAEDVILTCGAAGGPQRHPQGPPGPGPTILITWSNSKPSLLVASSRNRP